MTISAAHILAAESVLAEAVRRAWYDVLGSEPESDHASFFEAGGDSLAAVEMVEHLHKSLGRSIRIQDFYHAPSRYGLIRALLIDANYVPIAHHTTGRTVVRLRSSGTGRLWCFMPPLSGAVTRYASMAHLLPLADAVWACETPASMSRRGMKAVAEGLADALLDENLTDFDDLVVAGYSLGGVFAHEVAQALTARVGQMRVTGLLIDVPPADAPVPSLGDTLDSFVRVGWRIDTPEPQAFVDSAGNRDFVAIAAAAAAAGTLPKNAGACEVEEAWQVYEANTKIMDGYAPTPRPGDRRALLRGAQAGGALHSSSDLGWAACELDSTWAGILAPDRCWAVEVDHLALLEPPNDATVARWLIWVADCWPRTERTLID